MIGKIGLPAESRVIGGHNFFGFPLLDFFHFDLLPSFALLNELEIKNEDLLESEEVCFFGLLDDEDLLLLPCLLLFIEEDALLPAVPCD